MIRSSARFSGPLGLALLAAFILAPAAPAQNAAPAAPEAVAPQAPAPAAPVEFPKPSPANFSATAPSKQVIETFLQTSWGKVENRVWQVQAILKTPVDGLAKVVVLIGDKTGKTQIQAFSFLAFADGKHFIAGDRLVAPGAAPEPKPATPPVPAQPVPAPTVLDNPAFPKPDPANFTAAIPAASTVASFLHATWGFNDAVLWQIEAIQKTQLDGLSRVVVLFGDKSGKEKPQPIVFFLLPDGKHIAAGDQIVPFAADPFAGYRARLQKDADGPFRGSPDKKFELVEFADFQCPHCKAAQANMDKLVADYPQARIVFENAPIPSIHPQAVKAAEFGHCVAKIAGSSAFFAYAATVFEGQDALATPDGATLTINSALAKAGVDQAKATACAATPEAKTAVEASMNLSTDVGIYQVPTLMVNGRAVPANAPYETLKQIIDFQIKLDGIK